MAIQVTGVHKSYGRGARKTEVLRDFNMTIPKGHIYGLLGRLIRLTSPYRVWLPRFCTFK